MRTGVFLDSLSEGNILNGIRSGMSIISDGPVANLKVLTSPCSMSSIGSSIAGTKHTVLLEVRSTSEFGSIDSLKVFRGEIGQKETELISENHLTRFDEDRTFIFESECESYIRAEVWTAPHDSHDGRAHFCITNPVWFTIV